MALLKELQSSVVVVDESCPADEVEGTGNVDDVLVGRRVDVEGVNMMGADNVVGRCTCMAGGGAVCCELRRTMHTIPTWKKMF